MGKTLCAERDDKGGKGLAMRTYQTEAIRNVVLLSHSGAGKTTLSEALLFHTGAIKRMGRVEDGNTTSDFEPEERKRGGSVRFSLLPCEWRDTKINILDTPGYLDFIGDALSALRVADAALLLVDAYAGVEVGTEMMWKRAEERSLPRLILVNKMDGENADFASTLEALRSRFGTLCAPFLIPIGAQKEFRGVVNLLHRTASIEGSAAAVPDDLEAEVDDLRDRLVEAIAETDEELATKYLEGEEISIEEMTQALREGVKEGQIVPVLAGSALDPGLAPTLLDALVDLVPSPAERPAVPATAARGGTPELTPDPKGPLAALVFKSTADLFVGRLSYFRVYSGTLSPESQIWNSAEWQAERMGNLFVPRGKAQEPVEALAAGDIGALAKLSTTATGHTLTTQEDGLALEGVGFPEPVYSIALHPKSKADLDKMGAALSRLVEEDPSLRIHRDGDTAETILSGMGDAHVEVAMEILRRKFGVEVDGDLPKVPYRESILVNTRAEYKHKKQSGGHGQYGHVLLALEPLERGSGFEFLGKVVGGAVPKNYIPAVEKGVREALQEGVVAGYPVVDVRATLYDGSSHAVDSSDMAFKIAGTMCFKKGMGEASPALLEPIMAVQITVLDVYTGDIIGDLNSRRARVLGMMPQDGTTIIQAEAPLAEMLRYAPELRSMTQGRGVFTMQNLRYDEVPAHLKQRITEEARAK